MIAKIFKNFQHLYITNALHVFLEKNIFETERVQKRATEIIHSLRKYDYLKRLEMFNLTNKTKLDRLEGTCARTFVL